MGRGFWFFAIAVSCLAVGLPCLGAWLRRQHTPQCALDGVRLDPAYVVEIAEQSGIHRRFCCILCAESWLAKNASPNAKVEVTDEVSAKTIPADDAYFAPSSVMTNSATLNRIHAFADRDDAEAHARQFGGRLLEGNERPFARDHARHER